MPVQHCHDENTLRLHEDEAVRTQDELAETGELGIAKPVTPIRELAKGLGCVHRQLRQGPGVGLRVPGDELDGAFQVVNRRV
jgi:hypothetical protein